MDTSRTMDKNCRPAKHQGMLARGLTGLALLGLLAGAVSELSRWSVLPEAQAAIPAGAPAAPLRLDRRVTLTELSTSTLAMPAGMPAAHASALATLRGDEMLAFWWAGERESGADVRVYASRWSKGAWQAAYSVVDRESLSQALGFGVRRIGNPTAWTAADGRVHLFVVATGLGGWAASRIVHLVSDDAARHFAVRRVLPLSPLFNTSALVRTTPIGLARGGWWLPAYFELGNKYPLLMSFDESGEPRWLSRIGASTSALQPALVAVSQQEVRAWMRDNGDQRRIQQAISRDGGVSWSDLPASELTNHDSSVAALGLRGGGFVLLHNDAVTRGNASRQWLRLSVSNDAKTWLPGLDVKRSSDYDDEFSYPSVQQLGQELHVTYSVHRRGISHHVYRIAYERVAP